jgi:hypothetical protein
MPVHKPAIVGLCYWQILDEIEILIFVDYNFPCHLYRVMPYCGGCALQDGFGEINVLACTKQVLIAESAMFSSM